MWWVPIALAASSLYSTDQARDANRDALASQTNASNRQLQFQRNAALAGLEQGYPIYAGQVNALNRLYGMQGLPSIQAAPLNSLVERFESLGSGSGGFGGSGELPWGIRRALSTGLISEDQAARYMGS